MTIMAVRRIIPTIYESTKSDRASCTSTRILVKPMSDTEVNRFPEAPIMTIPERMTVDAENAGAISGFRVIDTRLREISYLESAV